ncbi:MAG: DUF72 domain-containing protein [Verrucomicrobiales bacterium]|nr:DUF72 domain-containing protein [Verrucomicrobiales bacterium]
MLFQREKIAPALNRLALDHNVFLGTCSWKFPGWLGILYDEDHYLWQTHFSKARFERDCLTEYAGTFRTVEVDATFYRHHPTTYFAGLANQVPDGFHLSFKVPDDITFKTFPNLKKFGDKRGQPNPGFLSPGLLDMGFLRRLEPFREKTGAIIFEFSHFHTQDFEHGRDFVAALDHFFNQAPPGWNYAVEIRNPTFLHPDYFAVLERHGVAHVYNHWTLMPSADQQLSLHPPPAELPLVARFLLTPSRSFDYAEHEFAPYHQLKEVDPSARQSLARLIHTLTTRPKNAPPAYLYIGNALEGNALHTIANVLTTPDQTH